MLLESFTRFTGEWFKQKGVVINNQPPTTNATTKGDSQELWVPVPDFPKYEINNRGRVRNRKTGSFLKVRGRYRLAVTLSQGGQRHQSVSVSDLLEDLFDIEPERPPENKGQKPTALAAAEA